MAKVDAVIGVHDFEEQVCEALGLDSSKVTRIIIDLDVRNYGPTPVYVEMIADERILALDWSKGLEGAEIVREMKGESEP